MMLKKNYCHVFTRRGALQLEMPLIGTADWQPVSTHLGKQWAAVRIHWLLMREPPQKWLPLRCRLACQGQSPAEALSPPTIRLLSGAVPQTGRQRIVVICKQVEVSRNPNLTDGSCELSHYAFNFKHKCQRVKLTIFLREGPCGGEENDKPFVSVERPGVLLQLASNCN